MKGLKTLVGLVIMLSIMSSCSKSNKVISGNFIQKRKYNKGFFVDRKSKKDFKINSYKVERNNDKTLSKYTTKKIEIDQSNPTEVLPEYTAEALTASIDNDVIISQAKEVKTVNPLLNRNVEQISTEIKLEEGESVSDTKIEKLGMIGFFIGLGSGMAQTAYILIPVFGAAALVMGIISLIKINKNPTKYRKKGLTYFSILFGVLGLLLFTLLVVLL